MPDSDLPYAAPLQVFAPFGRDQPLILRLLRRHGIGCAGCRDEAEMLDAVRQGRGPVILTDEALAADGLERLIRLLDAQPTWSDLPVIVLTRSHGPRPGWREAIARRQAMRWLPRPIDAQPLITMARLASEARRRQLQVGRLLRRQATLNDRLHRRARQLQRLTVELMHAEDDERRRLARLLHDDLQQLLVGAGLHASIARKQAHEGSDLAATLDEVRRLINEAQKQSRDLSHDLFPSVLFEADATQTLRWLARHAEKQLGVTVDLRMDGELGRTNEHLVRFLHRAVREILCNAAKHGRVDHAVIRARRTDGQVTVEIEDHGVGFDPQAIEARDDHDGFGLPAIRERVAFLGGQLKIESRPDDGTIVRLTIPAEPATTGPSHAPEINITLDPDSDNLETLESP